MYPVSAANDCRSRAEKIRDEQTATDEAWASLSPLSSRSDKVLNAGKKILKIVVSALLACTLIGIPFAVAILRDPKAEAHKAELAFLRTIKEQRESGNVC